jgi:hypothetical protein
VGGGKTQEQVKVDTTTQVIAPRRHNKESSLGSRLSDEEVMLEMRKICNSGNPRERFSELKEVGSG